MVSIGGNSLSFGKAVGSQSVYLMAKTCIFAVDSHLLQHSGNPFLLWKMLYNFYIWVFLWGWNKQGNTLFSSLYLIAEKNLQHKGQGRMHQTTLSVLLFLLFQSSMGLLILASKLAVSGGVYGTNLGFPWSLIKSCVARKQGQLSSWRNILLFFFAL